MHITSHAADRIQQRSIQEDQLNLVLEHGAWNSRGDRLTLGRRQVRTLLEKRRRELQAVERGHQHCSQTTTVREGK